VVENINVYVQRDCVNCDSTVIDSEINFDSNLILYILHATILYTQYLIPTFAQCSNNVDYCSDMYRT
jgi:hypothetical protein